MEVFCTKEEEMNSSHTHGEMRGGKNVDTKGYRYPRMGSTCAAV